MAPWRAIKYWAASKESPLELGQINDSWNVKYRREGIPGNKFDELKQILGPEEKNLPVEKLPGDRKI
jgi:hypothetical protein